MKSQKFNCFHKIVFVIATTLLMFGCEDTLLPEIVNAVEFQQLPDLKLTVIQPDYGSALPSGTTTTKEGVQVDINATVPAGFVFSQWLQTGGDGTAVFADSNSENTTVTISNGDVTIQPQILDEGAPSGSIAIQNKVPVDSFSYITDRSATVNLSYADSTGTVTHMKLSETSFATGTSTGWQAVGLSTTYDFPSDGSKTLYVRFRDDSGNESPLYSDSVRVDTTAPTPGAYGIDIISNPGTFPDYVEDATSSEITLAYPAIDNGSGVDKVYFSNSTTRPTLPQISDYESAAGSTYDWNLLYTTTRGQKTVYFWFEDKLGNISARYQDSVRFDDPYEGYTGNNSVDAVSSATYDINTPADRDSRLGLVNGYGWLVDADAYKFGHDMVGSSEYEVVVTVYVNDIISQQSDFPRIRFYRTNRTQFYPTITDVNTSTNRIQYTFDLYTAGNDTRYSYWYIMIDRDDESAPYGTARNYDIYWEFNYIGM